MQARWQPFLMFRRDDGAERLLLSAQTAPRPLESVPRQGKGTTGTHAARQRCIQTMPQQRRLREKNRLDPDAGGRRPSIDFVQVEL